MLRLGTLKTWPSDLVGELSAPFKKYRCLILRQASVPRTCHGIIDDDDADSSLIIYTGNHTCDGCPRSTCPSRPRRRR